jgi:hypothetical protein
MIFEPSSRLPHLPIEEIVRWGYRAGDIFKAICGREVAVEPKPTRMYLRRVLKISSRSIRCPKLKIHDRLHSDWHTALGIPKWPERRALK